MSKTARTYIQYITDPIVLVYPKFETPDVYVKDGVAGKPAYKTDAQDVEGGQAIAKAKAFVMAELVKLFPDMDPKTRRRVLKNGDTKTVFWPFKVSKDGTETFSAKTARVSKRTGELMRVPMFDAKNQQLPEGVYPSGGTVARLKVTLNAMPNDGGINFYLEQVQVLKLVESSFGKSGFEPTEGYAYSAPEETKEPESAFAEADESDATKF